MTQKTTQKKYLTRRTARAQPDEPLHDLITNVEGRGTDLEGVHLIKQDGGENADDDLIPILKLRQSMIQGVQISSSDQGRSLQVGATELMSRPEPGQVVVPNQQAGDHLAVAVAGTETYKGKENKLTTHS